MPETPEKCTCGTLLAENARFCHRCGRPVHELTPAQQEALFPTPAPAPVFVPPPQPPPISFSNPIAVRIALLMSLGIMMTEFMPFVNYLFFVWWLLAGWGAVRLYRRLTGLRLNVAGGARLGFLTGLFTFVGMTVFICFFIASSARQELMDQMVKQDPRMAEVVNNPTMFGSLMIMVLVLVFAMVVGICAAGGALGARFSPPSQPRV
jgi:hypothetical protein